MDFRNYKGTSLLNTLYKVLSNVLLNRVKPYAKEIIGDYQAGFTQGRLGPLQTKYLHSIKQIMEKSYEFDQDVYLLFVDSKQVYDSIKRSSLCRVMIELGIPAKMRLVKVCVQKSKRKVKFNSGISEDFSIETGQKQGDALSPILFNYALESVVRKV